jgi:hypothetical protein
MYQDSHPEKPKKAAHQHPADKSGFLITLPPPKPTLQTIQPVTGHSIFGDGKQTARKSMSLSLGDLCRQCQAFFNAMTADRGRQLPDD